jgi:hypothetical protein
LVFGELGLASSLELTDGLVEAFSLFLKPFIVGDPLGLFPLLPLQLHLQLPLLILPLLLTIPKLLLHLFPQIPLLLPLALPLLPLLPPLALQFFNSFEVLLLEESIVLVQFPNLVVFEFVAGSQFGDLLVKERNIGLVFIAQRLLFVCVLVEGLLEVADLGRAGCTSCCQPVLQLPDFSVSMRDDRLEFLLTPLELLTLILYLNILLTHQMLKLPSLLLQILDQVVVVRLHCVDVSRM